MIRKYKKYLALAISAAMILEGQVLTASATSSDSLDQNEEIVEVVEEAVEETDEEATLEDEEPAELQESETDAESALEGEESVLLNSDLYDVSLEDASIQGEDRLEESHEADIQPKNDLNLDDVSLLGAPDKISTTAVYGDFQIEDGVLIRYTGTDTDVVIPDGVTEISGYWYPNEGEGLKSVVLPKTVKRIDRGAFYKFRDLESINLENVEIIETYTFSYCQKLEYLNLESVVEIGERAFKGCNNLKEIVFSDELEEIKSSAFENCYMLSKIKFPKSLKIIGHSAFSIENKLLECSEVEIVLPESLEKIKNFAFWNRKISRIIIPENTAIGESALNAKIRQLIFAEGRKEVPGNIFGKQMVKHIYIPEEVKKIYLPDTYIIIHGKPGSYAEQYAENHNRFFKTELSLDACTTANIVNWRSKVEQYTWESDDESIATVDENGVVYGVAKGSCIITAIDEEGYEIGTCQVEVGPSVNILQQPESVSASVGDTVKFTVSGTGIVGYQWYFSQNGGKTWKVSGMSGANTDTLTVPVTAARIGQMYRCQLTGHDGDTIDSEAATIMAGLEIFMQPENVYSSVGESVAFKVGATGVQKYQWYFSQNGGKTWSISGMPGNGTSELVISVTQKRIGQKYKCVMTGANGDVLESEAATILQRPEITKQPSDVYAVAGDIVSFEITAVGAKSYQWFYSQNGGRTWTKSSMTGNKTKVLIIPVTASRIGQKYRCQVTGLDGKVLVSDIATIKSSSGNKN